MFKKNAWPRMAFMKDSWPFVFYIFRYKAPVRAM